MASTATLGAAPRGALIEIQGLSKRFGREGSPKSVQAVNNLSFTAVPGRVMGFLGPNGSGKTTTLSMVLGLVRPDSGRATLDGAAYSDISNPATKIGSALNAAFHPAHTGRAHLEIMARGMGLPNAAIDEALQTVGMAKDASRKTGGYSLGMRQRLALAGALLGNPGTLILDEPANGLDPEGIRWMRMFLRHLASEGRTILLSSHLLGEVQQTVDDLVVIRRGQLVFSGTPDELEVESGVGVVSSDNRALAEALERAGAGVSGVHSHRLKVTGLDAEQVGEIALAAGIALSYLAHERVDIEQRFLELVDDTAEGI